MRISSASVNCSTRANPVVQFGGPIRPHIGIDDFSNSRLSGDAAICSVRIVRRTQKAGGMSSGLLAPPRWRAQVSLVNLRRAVRLTARLHSSGPPYNRAPSCMAVEMRRGASRPRAVALMRYRYRPSIFSIPASITAISSSICVIDLL